MSVQLSEGQTFGPRAINVTRTTLVRYAGASGDFNPIHYSDRAAREAGMDGHLAKPVELSQLRELIEHWVRQRTEAPRPAAGA